MVAAATGGLDACERFLGAMPSTPGFAIVVVPQIEPQHENRITEVLERHSSMPVEQACDGAPIEPDHVYVIPPNRYLGFRDGTLELSDPAAVKAGPTAIDFALCSAARDQKSAAIGVVLAGAGNHGVRGVKEIKLAGGLVLVQDPMTTEHGQMPHSALATGVADDVLAPEAMPAALVRHAHDRPASCDGKLEGLPGDLPIGAIDVFRDAATLNALAGHVLPELVAQATAEQPVRVWIAGCATGEEAYSIAMLLIEQFQASGKTPSLQIFATDIDEMALEAARRGIYPASIASALSADRLNQFFVRTDARHYQVARHLRDSIVFASHNLISDAPFSRLDLISCRNRLIDLEPDLREQIISVLHSALKVDGYLLLGPSDSLGRTAAMFEPVAPQWRLFRRTGSAGRDLVTPTLGPHGIGSSHGVMPGAATTATPGSTRLLQQLLLEEIAPAAALIDRDFEILSAQGPLVNFLLPPQGEKKQNLLALARRGLRTRIHAVCRKSLRSGETAIDGGARVRRNGGYMPCRISARPVTEPRQGQRLLLVLFEDRPPETIAEAAGSGATSSAGPGTAFRTLLPARGIPEIGHYAGIAGNIEDQRELQERIVSAATNEQRRLGEELHDTTLQELAGLGLIAQELEESLDREQDGREHALATKLAAGIERINRQIRQLAHGLIPVPVDAEGLMSALAKLATRVEDESGISCTFVCPEPVQVNNDAHAMHLYRIAQEALTNAVKHAKADAMSILLARREGAVQLEIRDNGIGLASAERHRGGLGLRIMEHRCDLIGGRFSARRRSSGGTVISCELPLQAGTSNHG